METYKKVSLLTVEEVKVLYGEEGILKYCQSGFSVGELFLNPNCTFCQIAESIEIPGAFDYAVPQSWFEQNRPEGLNRAVWWYPPSGQEGHLFGKPLTLREMIQWMNRDYKKANHAKFIEQFKIVLDLARQNIADQNDEDLKPEYERQLEACIAVEDYFNETFLDD